MALAIEASPAKPYIGITDTAVEAAYSEVNSDDGKMVIQVPGLPRILNPKTGPPIIELGDDQPEADPHVLSTVTLEPALRSLVHLQPYYDFKDVDIITDRDVLAQLLSCVSTTIHTYRAKLIDSTFLLLREQVTLNEASHGKYAKAFASSYFDKAPGCEDTEKHFRLTSYRLGEIRFLIRHEADGMHGRAYLTRPPSAASEAQNHGNVRLTFGGEKISPDAVMEYHIQSPIDSQEEGTDDTLSSEIHASHLPKLWLAQISKFTVATAVKVESDGTDSQASSSAEAVVFPPGNIHTWPSVRQDTAKWEKEHQDEIAALHEKLVELCEGVKAAAAEYGDTTEFRCTLQGAWMIEANTDVAEMLPADLVERVKGHA